MTSHHLVQFVLHPTHLLGIAQHENVDPEQGGLNGFHAGGKQIDDHLDQLLL